MPTLLHHFPLFSVLLFASVSSAQVTAEPSPVKAPPDVLEFTNGDRLTGKLERAVSGNVVFHSDMAGDLTIPYSKVKTLTSGSEFVALSPQRASSPGTPAPHAEKAGRVKAVGSGKVTFTADQVELSSAKGTTETLPIKDVAYLIDVSSYAREVDHHAGFQQGWTGTATAGLTLVRSTQTATTFTGALNFVRAIPTVAYLPNRNRTTINVTESYGTNTTPVIPQTNPPSPPSVVQTSIFHADTGRDEYISPRVFALADLSFDHNFAQGLQLQQVFGGGVGWTLLQNAKEQLDARADVHYEKQQFLPTSVGVVGANGVMQDNYNLIGSTFQENYRRSLPRKFVLTEWANLLPAWNDRQAYSANAYLSLTMPIFKRLGATLSATDNYLNDPSPGYRTNSVQLVTGVTYTLK